MIILKILIALVRYPFFIALGSIVLFVLNVIQSDAKPQTVMRDPNVICDGKYSQTNNDPLDNSSGALQVVLEPSEEGLDL